MRLKSLTSGAFLLLAAAPGLADSVSDSPTRLKWQCSEQPAMRVVVNGAGTLASEQEPALTKQPIQVHAIKLQPDHKGPAIPTRIISTEESLNAAAASWAPGNAITTDDGTLRLDLTDKALFYVTNAYGNQALFRRFTCAPADKQAPRHYQCGSHYDLWISFTKSDSDARPEDQARVQYPGGVIELSQSEAASGARYDAADSSLIIEGDSAVFSLDGDEEHRCQIED